jgi:NAD(P)-dependent dehydrogenase (short-subunit alcohol dehydrogenase family)
VTTVLVVGARTGSLGEAVAHQCRALGYNVVTAGISGEERQLSLTRMNFITILGEMRALRPTHVVCTVGINEPEGEGWDPEPWYERHFATNVTGPMRLLNAWLGSEAVVPGEQAVRHFAAISSNSARVPRSSSAAYCASKAALSQALRVKAREGAGRGASTAIYGYEPGLISDTPMTRETGKQFPGMPLTRMRHPALAEGVPRTGLAYMVATNLTQGLALNGLLIPFDADEA